MVGWSLAGLSPGLAATVNRVLSAADSGAFRAPNIMKRVMRCHDFGSGREATRSQYREYWQGERQCHGPKVAPARRVAAKTGGTPQRVAGAPLAGMRPHRRAPVLRVRACYCPAAGSHPSKKRLEPAPPCAGHFVGRLDHAPRTRSRAAWCGQGRQAACGCEASRGFRGCSRKRACG